MRDEVTTLGLALAFLIPVVILLVAAPQRLYALASGVETGAGWRVLNGLTSLGVGVALIVMASKAGALVALPAAIAAAACATVIYSDIRYFLIPDLCTVAILAAAAVNSANIGLLQAIAGAAVGSCLLVLVILIGRLRGVEGMGFGDVKLGFALGALLGPQPVVWALCLSAVAGLVWALAIHLGRGQQVRVIPYGASLAAVAILMLCAKVSGVSVEPSWL
jgi:leader peptidase (prepilin peptidase)/N-methyltransferase